MAWSTREIAELAGTSLRAVRHYHEVGLLDEPERLPNGYKQYGVAHLVRLLRIKRLADLGFSLPQIAAMGEDDDHPEEALRELDAELAATIARLQRIRVELGALLRQSAPTDLPPEIATAAARAGLSGADRSFVVVMSRVLGPRALQAYAWLDFRQRASTHWPFDVRDSKLDSASPIFTVDAGDQAFLRSARQRHWTVPRVFGDRRTRTDQGQRSSVVRRGRPT
jgi:DNA-binding transcriptional MerR regulator